jgi:hypothetical protein
VGRRPSDDRFVDLVHLSADTAIQPEVSFDMPKTESLVLLSLMWEDLPPETPNPHEQFEVRVKQGLEQVTDWLACQPEW